MTEPMKYYYLKTKDKDPKVGPETFPAGPLPVLWMHEGFFSLIPKETIANFLDSAADGRKLQKDKPYFLRLFFCNSLSIDASLGRALAPDEDLHQRPKDQQGNGGLNSPVTSEVPT